MAPRGNTRRSKSRKRGGRTLFEKRDFKGNQHHKTSSNVEETSSTLLSTNTIDDIPSCSLNSGDIGNTPTLSASARKLGISSIDEASTLENKDEDRNESPDESYYILIDTDIFRTIISCIGICPQEHCTGKIILNNSLKEKFGLCCKLLLSCDKCDWSEHFYTSKQLSNRTGRKPFDINLRTVAAFREIGKGHSGIETVCGFMNLFIFYFFFTDFILEEKCTWFGIKI